MRSTRNRRLDVRAILALAFTFVRAQQLAVRHLTLHAVGLADAMVVKAVNSGDHCDQCTALCSLSAAAPTTELGVDGESACDPLSVLMPRGGTSLPQRLDFRSRAPPVLA